MSDAAPPPTPDPDAAVAENLKPLPHKSAQFFRVDDLQAGLGRRTVRGGALTAGSTAINFVVTTATTILITRNLTKEDFGLFGMVTVLTGFAAMFVDMGLSRAVIQKPQINHGQVSTLFWINLAIAALIAGFVAVMTPALVWFYDEPRLAPINLAMSGLFLISALSIQHKALLARRMEFFKINAISLAGTIISAGMAVTLALLDFGVWALVALPVTSQLTGVVGSWVACRWLPGRPRRGTGVRAMLGFGAHVTGFQFINYFARNADNAMLGFAWGAGPLGLYTRAYSLMMLPASRLNAPLTNIVVPALSRVADQPERYRRIYNQMISLTAGVLTPLVVWMILTIDLIVPLLLGDQWLDIVPIFYALGPACIMAATNASTGWLYQSYGHVERQTRWAIIGSPGIVIAAAIGLQWGALGVAIGISAAYVVQKPISFMYAAKGTPIKLADFMATLWLPILACAIASAAALVVSPWLVSGLNMWLEWALRTGVFGAAIAGLYLGTPPGRRWVQNLANVKTLLRKPVYTS